MLTEEQIAQYYREGYLVVKALIPVEEAQDIIAAAPAQERSGNWQAHIFDHANPDKDRSIHRLLTEPRLIEAVEDIFGVPARVYYGMLAVVPAHGGKGLPWHQDNQYSQILVSALNVFVALSEITPEKAILWVAPQSHLRGTQPANESAEFGGHKEAVVAPENGIQLPTMQPGDVCIFDRNTYHRSLQNETDEDRYAYAAQFAAQNSRYASTGKADPKWMLARDLRQRWQSV